MVVSRRRGEKSKGADGTVELSAGSKRFPASLPAPSPRISGGRLFR
jgi:hypothetical protein